MGTYLAGKPIVDLDAALWFDVAVQTSLGNSEKAELAAATGGPLTGEALRNEFAAIISRGSLRQWRADVLARKSTFAAGTGTVHGGSYLLESWGFHGTPLTAADLDRPSAILALVDAAFAPSEGPSIAPDEEIGEGTGTNTSVAVPSPLPGNSPHAGWSLYPQFAAYVATLALRNFKVDELLFQGGQNGFGGCMGLNTYPPEELWRNIGPTVAILDKLRDELGAAIQVLSLYRSPAYNACIDGSATHSTHMRFMAIDFRSDVGSPARWAEKLKDYRARGLFRGGIGIYSSFVHVDTRGQNTDW